MLNLEITRGKNKSEDENELMIEFHDEVDRVRIGFFPRSALLNTIIYLIN